MPMTNASAKKPADQDQRDPVGDRHGEQVAGGRERHHRRKQHQPDRIGNHGGINSMACRGAADCGRI